MIPRHLEDLLRSQITLLVGSPGMPSRIQISKGTIRPAVTKMPTPWANYIEQHEEGIANIVMVPSSACHVGPANGDFNRLQWTFALDKYGRNEVQAMSNLSDGVTQILLSTGLMYQLHSLGKTMPTGVYITVPVSELALPRNALIAP